MLNVDEKGFPCDFLAHPMQNHNALVTLLLQWGFFMSENNQNLWKKWIFSPLVLNATKTRKIAYVALMVALSIVCNMYFEFKLGPVQYSFTTAISVLIGVLIGPGAGFVACFIGDAVGFFVNPFGAYAPWIGLSTGLMAFIGGAVFSFFKSDKKWVTYLKIGVISLTTFLICSVGINTTFLWLSYYSESSFWAYFFNGYITLGQLIVSGVNYALLFIIIPIIKRVAFFKDLQL